MMRRPVDQDNVDELVSQVLNDERLYLLHTRRKNRSAVRGAAELCSAQGWRVYANDKDAAVRELAAMEVSR